MEESSLWLDGKEPTVTCDMEFNISHLTLIVEALGIYKDAGTKMKVGFVGNDGPIKNPLFDSKEAKEDLHKKLARGEAWVSRISGEDEFTVKDMESLDKLLGHFTVGLSVLEAKYESASKQVAETAMPAVVGAFYELLKKEGEGNENK